MGPGRCFSSWTSWPFKPSGGPGLQPCLSRWLSPRDPSGLFSQTRARAKVNLQGGWQHSIVSSERPVKPNRFVMIGTSGVWDIGLLRDLSSFNCSILLVSEVGYNFATHLSLPQNKKLQHARGKWISIFGFKKCSKCSVFHRWMREKERFFSRQRVIFCRFTRWTPQA